MAVESALENAFEHAASAVTVAVEDRSEECVITVADDGPGILEEELFPIEAQTETRLEHGRGLGLWQLRWCVDDLNGELSFETEAGTTVRITVPDRRESASPTDTGSQDP
jgi:sensor histidine kinase regulating citrate/malate metabolism